MPTRGDRNSLLVGDWELRKLDINKDQDFLGVFDCGDSDLNEYFKHDAVLNREQLIGQVYCLRYKATVDLCVSVALIDFSNDAIRKQSSKRVPGYQNIFGFDLDDAKRYPTLPAVKITRLGVIQELQGSDVGTNLLNIVKKLFVTENRTGCRFLTVDAYNKPDVLNFYKKNDFAFFYEKDSEKQSRAMYFDLKRYRIDLGQQNA